MAYIKAHEQQLYNNLLKIIQRLPKGCPVLIRKDWCSILGVNITGRQARRFGKELKNNLPNYLKHISVAGDNLNSYETV